MSVLPLDDPLWAQLKHAYGSAHDIPPLLEALYRAPNSPSNEKIWFDLWSSLAHQGDVYTASFAAVPHIVAIITTAPNEVDWNYLSFPAWVEICRHAKQVTVPQELQPGYAAALATLPRFVSHLAPRFADDKDLLNSALAATAVANQQFALAELIMELTNPAEAQACLDWFYSR